MWLRSTLVATAALIVPGWAVAQPVSGLYVGGAVGVNLMPPGSRKTDIRLNPAGALPGQDVTTTSKRNFATGFAGIGSLGYGLGNGLRVEAEGNTRQNVISGKALTEQKYGGMANLIFDLDVGLSYFYPYIGAGAGYVRANRLANTNWDGLFAYQGFVGAALPLPWAPGLSATMEYRFLGLEGDRQTNGLAGFPGGSVTLTANNDLNHSLLVGLRYAFNTAPPLPPAAPVASPVPAVVPARTYLVFFDWDRADLTDRARLIIAEAARTSTRVQTTRIEVQGNADRSGAPVYNQTLSLHRAQTVAAELVRHGVPHNQIDIQAFGDTRPLVGTAAGVREPQNRRVEIILR